MKTTFLVLQIVVLIGAKVISGARILAITTIPAHSHYTLTFSLVKELARRGHQVTFVNSYPQKVPIENVREVSLEASVAPVEEIKKGLFNIGHRGPYEEDIGLSKLGEMTLTLALENPNLIDLINSNETFDAVLIEHFSNEAIFTLARHFDATLIVLTSVPPSHQNNYLVGNPAPSSYVPNLYGPYTRTMSFWQRLNNFKDNILVDMVRVFIHLPKQGSIYRKYIRNKRSSTENYELEQATGNVSLMLTVSSVGLTDPVPLLPNVVEIAGHHVAPTRELPENLKHYLDDAPNGVVVFSLGSNLKSKNLELNTKKAILAAFAKLKEKVLWKFETDLPEAPDNVKVVPWLPQQDVLAHPNVKVFMSHGGLLSTIEAVHFGVPILGIPVFGDQKSNIRRAVTDGYALCVPFKEITEERLSRALEEITNNPKYRENIAKRSRLMRDRPVKPLDLAMHWIEHVIKNGGSAYRSSAMDLSFYQRDMIDLIAFLLAIVGLIVVSIYMTVGKIITSSINNRRRRNEAIDKKTN